MVNWQASVPTRTLLAAAEDEDADTPYLPAGENSKLSSELSTHTYHSDK